MINLSGYGVVETAVFVKWAIPGQPIKYFSDYHTPITINGDVYTNDGTLLGITSAQEEIQATAAQINVGISGLKPGIVNEVLNNQVKGSAIEIYRGFFDPTTHNLLNLGTNPNPVSKFKGFVTNYSVVDDVSAGDRTGVSEITLSCNSMVEILNKKIGGRRTNKLDFPGELSMDRVQALSKTTFTFGAPRK